MDASPDAVELRFPDELRPAFDELGLLGAGGLGAVWRARRRRDGLLVALKVLRPEVAADAVVAARFGRESELARRNVHPCLVAVHESGSLGGVAFIATELVAGRTLADELAATGPFTAARTLDVGLALARCLAALHARDIVHRDVKPGNVMVEPSGTVRLLDLGLARDMADGPGPTCTGVIVGTPRYMAPEVCRGAKATPAADVFALGMLLLDCLTGSERPPGAPPSATEPAGFVAMLSARARGDERFTRPPRCPGQLWPTLQTLLTNDPRSRLADGAAVLSALAGVDLSGPPGSGPTGVVHARPAAEPVVPRRRWWTVVLLLVVCAGLVLLFPRAPEGGAAARATSPSPPVTSMGPLTAEECLRLVDDELEGLPRARGWTVESRRLRMLDDGGLRRQVLEGLPRRWSIDLARVPKGPSEFVGAFEAEVRRWAAAVELFVQLGGANGPRFDDPTLATFWHLFWQSAALRTRTLEVRRSLAKLGVKAYVDGLRDGPRPPAVPPVSDASIAARIEDLRQEGFERVSAALRRVEGAGRGPDALPLPTLLLAAVAVNHGEPAATIGLLQRLRSWAAAARALAPEDAVALALAVDALEAARLRHMSYDDAREGLARLAERHLPVLVASRGAAVLSVRGTLAAAIWHWYLHPFFDPSTPGDVSAEGLRRAVEVLKLLPGDAYRSWRATLFSSIGRRFPRDRVIAAAREAGVPVEDVPR